MIDSDFLELEKLFLALGDKTRLRLLALMADGEVSVGFLAERLGESQPKVSRHVAYLRNAGVVYTRRDGKWIYYGISYPGNTPSKDFLGSVVRELSVMRVDRENVYLSDGDKYIEPNIGPESDTYVDTDMYEPNDGHEGNTTKESGNGSVEMDVFLL